MNMDTFIAIAVLVSFWGLVWLAFIIRHSLRYVYLISYCKTVCVSEDDDPNVKFGQVLRCAYVTLPHRIAEEDIRAFRFANGDNNVNHCQIVAISKIQIKLQKDT